MQKKKFLCPDTLIFFFFLNHEITFLKTMGNLAKYQNIETKIEQKKNSIEMILETGQKCFAIHSIESLT